MSTLQKMSHQQGLFSLEKNLIELEALVKEELVCVEHELRESFKGQTLVQQGANQLVSLGGKRLRPLCVLLAAQVGLSDMTKARQLGVAVELIHNATLLHDDVVDLAEKRRGSSTVRMHYGNALSIFAGDWLLIEALRIVEKINVPGLLTQLFSTIEEMIFAESLQLESRRKIDINRERYFKIIEGKTASLFRFALFSGASLGNLSQEECLALAQYGIHLGIAFQLMDDLLDFTSDATQLGKDVLVDLHEGKMTFPLMVACEKDKNLCQALQAYVQEDAFSLDMNVEAIVLDAVRKQGGVQACQSMISDQIARARSCLDSVRICAATNALSMIAQQTMSRKM